MWSAAWAWLILAIFIIVFVIIFDVHAHLTHGHSMTGQMQVWLSGEVTGPFIFAAWIAIPAGLLYHFFLRRVI